VRVKLFKDHRAWVPGEWPAPSGWEVRTREPGDALSSVVRVYSDDNADELLATATALGRIGTKVPLTKISTGPVGRWMYALHSHEFPTDSAKVHFLGLCLECDANTLIRRPLGEIEGWYRLGSIGQDEWEGYTWAWATGAYRYGDYPGWTTPPVSHTARAFGERLRELHTGRSS
jgi:hypothetical protein